MTTISRPKASGARLPGLDAMIELYAKAMHIHLSSERLLPLTESLRRMAINTEILACKAGVQVQVFSVTAKEVHRCSQDVNTHIRSLLEQSTRVAGDGVRGASRARLCEKFTQAGARITPGDNLEHLHRVLVTHGKDVLQQLEEIDQDLRLILRTTMQVKRFLVNLPVLAVLFRVEAARCDERLRSRFLDNVARMNRLYEQIRDLVDGIEQDAELAIQHVSLSLEDL